MQQSHLRGALSDWPDGSFATLIIPVQRAPFHLKAGKPGDFVGGSRLSSLVDQLRASPAGVEDPGALVEVAVSAQQEMDKDKPNKHILGGLLHALMAGVQNSATLATAVVAIQHAVTALL
jgi:hypothetical protein